MGLAVATGRIRGVVSTFTLLLQRQILSEDFPIAADVVRGHHRPHCACGAAPGPWQTSSRRRAVLDLRQGAGLMPGPSDETAAVLEFHDER